MSVLKEICDKKILDVKILKSKTPESKLLNLIKYKEKTRGFKKAIDNKISKNKFALIAEIKKASPSKGIIKKNFIPIEIANSYQRAGATCLSILTEEYWFKGKNSYLTEVRNQVDLPILRKDFILDPWQVLETRNLGADCVLIILSAVDDNVAEELKTTAKNVGLDILVEVHNEDEIERAIRLNPDLIGINNRNLKTLKIDLNNTVKLANLIPNDYVIVCESGLNNNEDLKNMHKIGINTFLVGESLMRNKNIEAATKKLLQQ